MRSAAPAADSGPGCSAEMETPVAQQIVQAGNALAVGVGLALVYDGLRAWRRSVGGRHHAADLLFWCVACGGLFLLGMAAGQGQLRLFMALCALAGSGTYFWLVSPVLLPFLCRGLAALRRLGGIFDAAGEKSMETGKKICKNPKKALSKTGTLGYNEMVSSGQEKSEAADSAAGGDRR